MDEKNSPLTHDEIRELRDFLEGRRAVRWISDNLKSVATWFIAVMGAWLLFGQQIAHYLASLHSG